MSDWLSPNPPHIVVPLHARNKVQLEYEQQNGKN